MRIELDATEQRVIGSLLEKERTVPDTYPMTLNGLRTACNQTSGRDPVLSLSDAEVQAALDNLRAGGLTRVLHASHGARVPKFRQVLDEVLALEDGERAVLTLLLLRGPLTPGELRSRSERLHPFADIAEVGQSLASLASRDEPLVEELPRRPGQKEQRWRHLVGSAAAQTQDPRRGSADAGPSPDPTTRDAMVMAAYESAAAGYADALIDELAGKPFDRWLLERLADLAAGGPVAEVGCGPGQVAAHLAAAGAQVTGFDLVPGMVEEARRRFPELTFAVADLRSLPAPPGADGWAAIAAWYSLVHLAGSELPAAIAGLTERLRAGGWLAVAVHVGGEVRHVDELFGQPVELDFILHDRDAVVAAVRAARLEAVEWYHRAPYEGAEAETERIYVLGRRPERPAETGPSAVPSSG